MEVWLNIPDTVTDEANPSTSNISSSKQCTPTPIKSSSEKILPAHNNSSTQSCASIPSTSNESPCKQSSVNQLKCQPSTSAQAMARSMPKVAETVPSIKQEIKQEPIVDSVVLQNGQILSQLAPMKIKTVQPPPSLPLKPTPQLRICDQNNVKVSTSNSPTSTVVKSNSKKTYMKCVGKDGKVSLMELVQDEKNPKLFKMVLPQGVQTNNLKMVQQSHVGAPVVLPSNFIKPINVAGQSINVGTPLIRTLSAPNNFRNISINSTPSSVQLPSTLVNIQNSSHQVVNRQTSPLKTMPKLVAINSPRPSTSHTIPLPKINVVPTQSLTSNQSLVSIPTSSPNKQPVGNIIHKNNKVLILDSNRMSKTPQQSLLKPQVSLLKPRSTMPNNNSVLKKITVGLENTNINVFVPAHMKLDANAQKKSQIRQRYAIELEQRFFARKSFMNMTDAIAWLLKEIQLISPLAEQLEFRESFPFAVKSLADFHGLLIAKQRNFEVCSQRSLHGRIFERKKSS